MTGAPISDVDSLLGVLESGAAATDAEDVDLLAHGLQCAALLAGVAPDDEELQVAGLVHDVGSVLWPGRPRTHARAGAAAVADLLGERVAWLVGHHDDAKVPGRDVPPLTHWRPIVEATAGRAPTRLPRTRPGGTRR